MNPQAQVSSESNRASKRKGIFTPISTERWRPKKRSRRTGGLLSGREMGISSADVSPQFLLSVSKYSYKPLEDGQIRLLQMSARGSGEGPIFSMVHVSLDEASEYMALSYCWGADSAIYPIQIDNVTVYVRSNLHQALREFKSAEMEGFLRICAICI
jgi:hypothetical protein